MYKYNFSPIGRRNNSSRSVSHELSFFVCSSPKKNYNSSYIIFVNSVIHKIQNTKDHYIIH